MLSSAMTSQNAETRAGKTGARYWDQDLGPSFRRVLGGLAMLLLAGTLIYLAGFVYLALS